MVDKTIPELQEITNLPSSSYGVFDDGIQTGKVSLTNVGKNIRDLLPGNKATRTLEGYGNFTVPPNVVSIKVTGMKYVTLPGCVFLDRESYAWAWGLNSSGRLGVGDTNNYSSPVRVLGGQKFGEVYSKNDSSCGLTGTRNIATPERKLYSWGLNNVGQLSITNILNQSSPTGTFTSNKFQMKAFNGPARLGFYVTNETPVSPEIFVSAGLNSSGEIGDGTTNNRSQAIAVIGGRGEYIVDASLSIAQSFLLKNDGSLFSFGSNTNGELGQNNVANCSSPISVSGTRQYSKLFKTLKPKALDRNGICFAWGPNTSGALGVGTLNNASSPLEVLGGHLFGQVLDTANHSNLALTRSGVSMTWGNNDVGQLGDGTTENRSSPVSVVGGHVFKKIYTIARSCWGLKADGSVWGWGDNATGQLGDGTTNHRSSPVQMIGGHVFRHLGPLLDSGTSASLYLLKNDGSIWGVGRNVNGQLGDGTTENRSSPVSVIGGITFRTSHDILSESSIDVTAGDVIPYEPNKFGSAYVDYFSELIKIDLEYAPPT